MKMFCITDNIDTGVGLKLAGIEYEVILEKEKIINKIQEILKDSSIGILGITDNICNILQNELKEIEENHNIPLIIRIPNSFERD